VTFCQDLALVADERESPDFYVTIAFETRKPGTEFGISAFERECTKCHGNAAVDRTPNPEPCRHPEAGSWEARHWRMQARCRISAQPRLLSRIRPKARRGMAGASMRTARDFKVRKSHRGNILLAFAAQ